MVLKTGKTAYLKSLAGTLAIGIFLGIKLLLAGVVMLTVRAAAKRGLQS